MNWKYEAMNYNWVSG